MRIEACCRNQENLNSDVWKYIDYEIQKRKRDGKEDTDVVLSGIRLPKAKVERECQRYTFVSTVDRFHRRMYNPKPVS